MIETKEFKEETEEKEKKLISIELKVRTAKQIRPVTTEPNEKKNIINFFYKILTEQK